MVSFIMQKEITTTPIHFNQILPQTYWQCVSRTHLNKVILLIGDYQSNRSRGIKQPVMDFLFEYYPFRASWLKKWSPGLGVALEYDNPNHLPPLKELTKNDSIAFLDPTCIPKKRAKSYKWILNLLQNTKNKRPAFGCFGMHEWAMVYKSKEIRHHQIPLRMKPKELAEFVESRPLVCTHFDAFRFFTKEATPLNKNQLSRETFENMEQPGCIHSNMDLYKWAFKGFPWISSDTVFAAFKLAFEARKFDMKASPYDLAEYGLEPIKIETEQGRSQYLNAQQEIFEKAIPVRDKLIAEYEQLFMMANNQNPP